MLTRARFVHGLQLTRSILAAEYVCLPVRPEQGRVRILRQVHSAAQLPHGSWGVGCPPFGSRARRSMRRSGFLATALWFLAVCSHCAASQARCKIHIPEDTRLAALGSGSEPAA